jgi:hypothetical protein
LGSDNKLHIQGYVNSVAFDNGASISDLMPFSGGKVSVRYGSLNMLKSAGLDAKILSEGQDLRLQPDAGYNTTINELNGSLLVGTAIDSGFKLDVMGKFRVTDGNAYATFDTTSGLIIHSDGGGGNWTVSLAASGGSNLLVGNGSSAIYAGSLQGLGRDISVTGGTGWKTILGSSTQNQSCGVGISTMVVPTISQTATAGISVLRVSPFLNTAGSGQTFIRERTNTASNGAGTHSTNFSVNTLFQVDGTL